MQSCQTCIFSAIQVHSLRGVEQADKRDLVSIVCVVTQLEFYIRVRDGLSAGQQLACLCSVDAELLSLGDSQLEDL